MIIFFMFFVFMHSSERKVYNTLEKISCMGMAFDPTTISFLWTAFCMSSILPPACGEDEGRRDGSNKAYYCIVLEYNIMAP